jgi:hypothetical protein
MASGLIALLDDIAAIAKVAAASLDDVAVASAKAGSKAAGVVIDDAAVTPKYVVGFTPDRELPIVWKIARGSLFNKLVLLLPVFILLAAFLPQALTPLLMLGGGFLCFEAAEKLMEKLGLMSHAHGHDPDVPVLLDPAAREATMVKGAIRTDFILSAEILAISLGELGDMALATKAAALAAVSVVVTIVVYGAVALIVKMDDVGLKLARHERGTVQAVGRGLVAAMPKLLAALAVIGTAAMAWVGGGILLHGFEVLGVAEVLPHAFHDWAAAAGSAMPVAGGFVTWLVYATLSGLFGLAIGVVLAYAIAQFTRLRGAPASERKAARG